MTTPPPIVTRLMELWHVPPPLQARHSQALGAARWSRAREWRQTLMVAYGTGLMRREKLLGDTCSPPAAIAVIEALVAEGRLDRRSASALEAWLRERVDGQGQWQGRGEGAGPAPLGDRNDAISRAFEGCYPRKEEPHAPRPPPCNCSQVA